MSGRADVDESMITGESRPVTREEGDRLVAGTVVSGTAVQVRVDAVGEDTALAGIQRMVADAEQSRTRTQALADRAAAWLFYVSTSTAAVTFGVWALIGNSGGAVSRTVTVLVISCPHALGLAIPLVVSLSTAMSARTGILVKDRLALEQMRLVDVVLFDKTGTLTKGEHAVADVVAIDDDEGRLLALAGGAERNSEHPLARAIVAAAGERGEVPLRRTSKPSPDEAWKPRSTASVSPSAALYCCEHGPWRSPASSRKRRRRGASGAPPSCTS